MSRLARSIAVTCSVLACLAVGSAEAQETGDESDSTRLKPVQRLFIGQEMGTLQGGLLWIDGHRVADEGANFYFGGQAGYARMLSHSWGVVALTRIGFAQTDWALKKRENRYRIDLALGPEFRIPTSGPRRRQGCRISLPFGPTWTSIEPGESRRVEESYSSGWGLNLGLTAGCHGSGPHHGAYFDLGWVTHLTWIDHLSRIATPEPRTVAEEHRTLDHVLMLTVGYLYQL